MSGKKLSRSLVLSAEEIDNTVQRIAFEILERHGDSALAFVGIHSGGVPFADRVHAVVGQKNSSIAQGSLDITLYRDDLDNLGTIPSVKGSHIPFDVDGATIVLFDDVLFTGRTIRAALNVLMDYGRPKCIELAVLVDRGNRELPIAPDYTGRVVKTEATEHIAVRFRELHEEDGVFKLTEDEA